jgi:hypothetical protein
LAIAGSSIGCLRRGWRRFLLIGDGVRRLLVRGRTRQRDFARQIGAARRLGIVAGILRTGDRGRHDR